MFRWLCVTIYSWFFPQTPPHYLFNYLSSLRSLDSHVPPKCNQLPSLFLASPSTLTLCQIIFMYCSPAFFSGWISGYLTCLLSLNFASAQSMSACHLSVFPHRRLLPHSEVKLCSLTRLLDFCLFGLVNIVNKILKPRFVPV